MPTGLPDSVASALEQGEDVVVLCPASAGEPSAECWHGPRLREQRVARDECWDAAQARLEAMGLSGEVDGLALAIAAGNPAGAYRRAALALAAQASAVVHDSPFTAPLFTEGCPVPEIYHVPEPAVAGLAAALRGPNHEDVVLKLLRLEGALAGRATRLHVASAAAATGFALLYGVEPARLACADGAVYTPAGPLLLAFNDYSVRAAASGGAVRLLSLLGQTGADSLLVTFGARFTMALLAPGLLHITVPKTPAHVALEARLREGEPVSANDVAAALMIGGNRVLADIAGRVVRRVAAVVLEHPYMVPVLDLLDELRPGLPVVYSAHNVEARYKPAILRGHSQAEALAACVTALENRAVARAQLIVCCTADDAAAFAGTETPVVVAANGCDLPSPADTAPPATPCAGFLGSNHAPNAEAAAFIVNSLAPAMPEVRFEVIGSVCAELARPVPENVVLHGEVTADDKTALMSGWDVALNPIGIGGGSSLKLPDYLAHGLPVLSTAIGARGVALVERGAGVVAAREDFAAALGALLADPELRALQGMRARLYAAEVLGWAAVAQEYRARLATLWVPPQEGTGPRLLVVAACLDEPPAEGAESQLINLVAQLRPFYGRLDLATIAATALRGRFHFACQAVPAPGGVARLAPLFDACHDFPVAPQEDAAVLAPCRTLERLWGQEQRALLTPFAARLLDPTRPRVFSGFYGGERRDGVLRRWTAPEFSILLPATARVVKLSGTAPAAQSLEATLVQLGADGAEVPLASFSRAVPKQFTLSLALPSPPGDGPLLLCCTTAEFAPPADHRPLGLFLDGVSAMLVADGALVTAQADLAANPEAELREANPPGWTAALSRLAEARGAEADAAFADVHGPYAPGLTAWLAANAAAYDAVLVQGVPCGVLTSAMAALSVVSDCPRVVLMPYLDPADRLHHWRLYSAASAAADVTLSPPAPAATAASAALYAAAEPFFAPPAVPCGVGLRAALVVRG